MNIEIKIENAPIRYFDVDSMLDKIIYMLNLVFWIMQNDGLSNSNFNKILKKVEFHEHLVSRMTLEKMICHFLIDSSNEKFPDLKNNVTSYVPNDDMSSIGVMKSGEA